MQAISLFSGAGGMDVGFVEAGVNVIWANECDGDAARTYKENHPNTNVEQADIRDAKRHLNRYSKVDMVFGGPPCQGFSVAGKMDPDDERSTMIWEFFDIIGLTSPRIFVMENVKALGELARWKDVREKIYFRANELGYSCFSRVLNATDFGIPQKRERVFFIGVKKNSRFNSFEEYFDLRLKSKYKHKRPLRECLLAVGKAGTLKNPISCTAKITLAAKPILRKSPYAGMLFNGMGRPLDFEGQANTLPASMGGNKTPIVDEMLLHNPNANNWVKEYHNMLLRGNCFNEAKVPDYFRRLTIKEAAAIQTFPSKYVFCGEKSSVYRQIGNAVPCDLAQNIAEIIVEFHKKNCDP